MQNTSNGMSTAALVLSIAGLLTMCCGGSVVLGSLAILFALLSRGTEPMNGQAKVAIGISIAGVVLGIAAFVIGAAATVLCIRLRNGSANRTDRRSEIGN